MKLSCSNHISINLSWYANNCWQYMYVVVLSVNDFTVQPFKLEERKRERSGRVLDLRLRGHGFEPHWHHCIVSLSKIILTERKCFV